MDSKENIFHSIHNMVQNNELTNDDIVEIINHLGGYLNIKTITKYAAIENISYNGALNRIKLNKIQECEIFGSKFVIDNE